MLEQKPGLDLRRELQQQAEHHTSPRRVWGFGVSGAEALLVSEQALLSRSRGDGRIRTVLHELLRTF